MLPIRVALLRACDNCGEPLTADDIDQILCKQCRTRLSTSKTKIIPTHPAGNTAENRGTTQLKDG